MAAMQLIKKHWRAFVPGRTRLTTQQRNEFLSGWLIWLGAESVGVLLAILNLIFVPLVVFLHIAVPETVLTVPVLVAFTDHAAAFPGALSDPRARAARRASIGAAFSAMALQLTVGRAVAEGLVKDGVPFLRTAKGCGSSLSERFPAFWEALLGLSLLLGALTLYLTNEPEARAIYMFSAVMACRACPSSPRSASRCSSGPRSTSSRPGGSLPLHWRRRARACRVGGRQHLARPGSAAASASCLSRGRRCEA